MQSSNFDHQGLSEGCMVYLSVGPSQEGVAYLSQEHGNDLCSEIKEPFPELGKLCQFFFVFLNPEFISEPFHEPGNRFSVNKEMQELRKLKNIFRN